MAAIEYYFEAKVRSWRGSGIIWNISPNETPVIPAKAGIQSVKSAFPRVCGVDSRFRGNDCGRERRCLPNDATTRGAAGRHWRYLKVIGNICAWQTDALGFMVALRLPPLRISRKAFGGVLLLRARHWP